MTSPEFNSIDPELQRLLIPGREKKLMGVREEIAALFDVDIQEIVRNILETKTPDVASYIAVTARNGSGKSSLVLPRVCSELKDRTDTPSLLDLYRGWDGFYYTVESFQSSFSRKLSDPLYICKDGVSIPRDGETSLTIPAELSLKQLEELRQVGPYLEGSKGGALFISGAINRANRDQIVRHLQKGFAEFNVSLVQYELSVQGLPTELALRYVNCFGIEDELRTLLTRMKVITPRFIHRVLTNSDSLKFLIKRYGWLMVREVETSDRQVVADFFGIDYENTINEDVNVD